MTGAASDKACPADWQGLDELSRLAVVGQFSRIATRPASLDGLQLRPEIPPSSLPPMAEELRPLFRRILDSKLADAEDVVRLIASRGYCVNPIDWMPKRSDARLPQAYDIWRDWLEGNVADYSNDVLQADTWDSVPTHSRHRHLTALHGSDADAARALIASVIPTLAADQRLRMLQCLRQNLSDQDRALLESFTGDRSSKVQAFVKTQLARLGQDTASDEAASRELSDFLEIQRAGLLSRRKVITTRKLKNDAQRKRRRTVLGRTSLNSLADALGVSAEDFVAMWDFGGANDEISEVVASTATDGFVDRFAARMVDEDASVPQSLMDRITAEHQRTLGLRVLAKDDWQLHKTTPWFPLPDGSVTQPEIAEFKALDELIALAVQNEKSIYEQPIAASLGFLGLIADRDAAAAIVERLIAAGVMTVDPRLTLLRLNAAL